MADAGGLQLLPSQKKHFSVSFGSDRSLLFVLAIVLLIISGMVYGIIAGLKSKTIDSISLIDNELAVIHKSRDKKQENRLTVFSRELITLKSLLQDHIFWSVGFSTIESLIEPRVQFVSMSADAKKKSYSFHATTDSYATVARQLAVFYANPAITNVELTRVSMTGGKADFNVDITFQADKFLTSKNK